MYFSTQVNNSKDIDLVIPMYNLTEYIDNYLKTLRSLWRNYIDEPALDDNAIITHFLADNNFWRTPEFSSITYELILF